MKFDKETVIALIACTVLLIGWEPICRKMGWISDPKPTSAPAVSEKVSSEKTAEKAAPTALPETKKTAASPATERKTVSASVPQLPAQTLENDSIRISFDPNRGCIDGVTMKKFLDASRKNQICLDNSYSFQPGALSVTLGDKDKTPANVVEIIDNSRLDERTYRLSRRVRNAAGQEVVLTQTWRLGDNYSMDYKFSMTPRGKEFVSSVSLCMGELASWTKLSGDYLRSDIHEFAYLTQDGGYDTLSVSAKDEKIAALGNKTLKWAALTNKYFAVVLVPGNPGVFRGAKVMLDEDKKFYSGTLSNELGVAAFGQSGVAEYFFRYYVGPKESDYLSAFEPGATKLIHYSWGPINTLARWLLWGLERLRALCGSYGWSIIILTLIVRLAFYPVTLKANSSMQKMQAVQPRIKAMREKYKDNPQLLNTKMMELYREEKINPFGGCFPILLQIPVFFALYAALDGALQLRQVPFLWSPDLAGPDTVFSFPLPFSIFGIANFHLNPLVIAMTVFMVIQQHITPNSMEPTQKKMMAMMPFMMLIFLYELPSGLTLYWTVSNIFSIVQLLIQQKMSKKAAAAGN